MSVASAAKIKRMTEAKCLEWSRNPTVNPLTGRDIEVNKGTYVAIAERCKNAFGIDPSGDYDNETEVATMRRLLPKTYAGWTIPRTPEAWATSMTREQALLLGNAVRKFGFITEAYVQEAAAFIKIGQLLLDAEVIPEAERATAEALIATLNGAMFPMNKIRKYMLSKNNNIADYKRLINKAIETKLGVSNTWPSSHTLQELSNDVSVFQFDRYAYSGATALTEEDAEIDEMLIALTALETELVLQRANPAAADADAYAIPASRERSLPESLSRRRVKTMKPKRRPEDPDEYYPWSATEEAAPTDRSRFRSHAKLSAVSAGPQPSPGAAPLAPLDPKKRTAMLAELREACTVMKDMISMQRFDRMNKKALQLVVRLGAARRGSREAAGGLQRCYYVRNLYDLWASAAKSGRPLVDPLTRDRVTADEKSEIMAKIRHLRPNAPDLREHKVPTDPKLELNVQQVRVPVHNLDPIPAGANIVVAYVGMYKLTLQRKVGRNTYIISELGMIPADIELADVGGDANLTSAAVIASIRRLFDEGRLLASNFIPYRCCTIHLRKPLSYWLTQTTNSPMSNRVNMRRWNLMATEVYGAL